MGGGYSIIPSQISIIPHLWVFQSSDQLFVRADAINAVLNDNPDDDVAIASLEDSLKKESKKENEHLQELIQSKATLDGTSTKGKAEEAGLALEKREVQREIASQKRKIEKSQVIHITLGHDAMFFQI